MGTFGNSSEQLIFRTPANGCLCGLTNFKYNEHQVDIFQSRSEFLDHTDFVFVICHDSKQLLLVFRPLLSSSSDTEYYLYKCILQQNETEKATLSNSTSPEDAISINIFLVLSLLTL